MIFKQKYLPEIRQLSVISLQAKKAKFYEDTSNLASVKKNSKGKISKSNNKITKSSELDLPKNPKQKKIEKRCDDDEDEHSWDLRSIKYEEQAISYKRGRFAITIALATHQNDNDQGDPREPGSQLDEGDITTPEQSEEEKSSSKSQSNIGDILLRLDDRNTKLAADSDNINRILEMPLDQLSNMSE